MEFLRGAESLQRIDKNGGVERVDVIQIDVGGNQKIRVTAASKQNGFRAVKVANDILFIPTVIVAAVDAAES